MRYFQRRRKWFAEKSSSSELGSFRGAVRKSLHIVDMNDNGAMDTILVIWTVSFAEVRSSATHKLMPCTYSNSVPNHVLAVMSNAPMLPTMREEENTES